MHQPDIMPVFDRLLGDQKRREHQKTKIEESKRNQHEYHSQIIGPDSIILMD